MARRTPEAPKDPRRGEFARDRARVVHSSALRRLAAKTQVVGAGTDDFVRNRLTHSLEVAQVGRELGAALGCDPDVVDTACLAHDLGHPPFGHNGEVALEAAAAGIGGFEGNAQTLRLLTRLEPKVVDPVTGRGVGLNLTRAILDAATKYPWLRGGGPHGTGKFGVYQEEAEVFGWLRQAAPEGRTCVEAQVMDLSDDVAYSVHDVEDAVVGGYLDLELLSAPSSAERIARQVRDWYLADCGPGEVAEALDRLRALPAWLPRFDGGHRSLAALKDLTSQLIGRFTTAVERATRAAHGDGPLTRYAADVVVPRDTRCEIAVLKGMAAVWVMTARSRQPAYEQERVLLTELVEALTWCGPVAMEIPYAAAWEQAGDDAGRLRAVIDQVAALTDASARGWHARLARPEAGARVRP